MGDQRQKAAAAQVAHWVRQEIRELSAYHVPNPGDLVKLDAMENPYRWPAAMQERWLETLRSVAVNRYPDPSARELTAVMREQLGVPDQVGVLLGNGSDELIQIMALAMLGEGRTIVAPDPSFVMYRMIAKFAGYRFVGVPLDARDFSLDADIMLQAILREQPAIVFIAHPNNPTGNLVDPGLIEEIAATAPGLVVIDEAYGPFTHSSFLGRVGEWPNLVVMGTVSKLGLAGLRLGFLAGPQPWVDEFDKLRLPYNINVLTQATARFALEHMDEFRRQTALICEERARVIAALEQQPGVTVYPSEANFVLFRVQKPGAPEVVQGLRERGVLIKSMHGASPLLDNCLRTTVGTAEENLQFLSALADVIGKA